MSAHPYQPGECLRIRDERWRVLRADLVDDQPTVDVVGCESTNAGARAIFLTEVERITRLPWDRTPRLLRPARWRSIVRARLREVPARFDSLRTAAAADIRLLPFQLEPALATTLGIGCRLLIADDVGLGKTIQAGLVIAEVLARTHDGHALVVAPAALRQQWSDELRKRFHLAVTAVDAAAVSRAVRSLGSGVNPWAEHRVAVVSIDYVKRHEVLRALEALVWDVVVFDEAHALTGVSDRAAAAQRLAGRARTLVSLTATPHSGDADAFARLVSLGRLKETSPPLLLFRRSRRDVGMPASRRTRWFAVRSTDAELDMHRRLLEYARTVCRQRRSGHHPARLAMSILLKRGCSSAASLARSVERRRALLAASPEGTVDDQLTLPFESAEDDEPLTALAIPGLVDRETEDAMLAALLDAALIAALSERKLDVLQRLLRRVNEPAIVFTEYRDTLEHIASTLHGHRLAIVHGGLAQSERRRTLREFTEGSANILLATDAASEGLNLQQRCRRIINIELPWTPLRLEQRVGRVDRIGQQRIVHATHLIARGTVEEDIVARLLTRMSTADAALHGLVTHDEDEIVSAVTSTARSAPTPGPGRSGNAHLVVPDLRDAAEREVAMLTTNRQLASSGSADDPGGRPVITRIRRRGRPSRLWAVRLLFCDRRACVRWTTIVGLTTEAASPHGGDLRRDLDPFFIETSLQGALESLHARLMNGAERFAKTAIAREDEILSLIHDARGRIPFVTRGLFNRRDERASSVRAAILEDSARQCERQRQQLSGFVPLSLGGCELTFAVVFE